MGHRIHIVGASVSGTTTLGKTLTETLGCRHHDTKQETTAMLLQHITLDPADRKFAEGMLKKRQEGKL